MRFADDIPLLLLNEDAGYFAPIPVWKKSCALAALMLAFSTPQTRAQLSGSLEHEPIRSVRSGERIEIAAEFATAFSVDSARVYFRAAHDASYAFVPMEGANANYAGVLPALTSDAETLEYMILVRSVSGEIEPSPIFRAEVQPSADSGVSALPLTVFTELSQAPSGLPGFADNLVIKTIEPENRYAQLAGTLEEPTQDTSGEPAPASIPSAATTSATAAGSRSGAGALGIVGIGAAVAGLAAGGSGGGEDSGPTSVVNRPPSFASSGTASLQVPEGTAGPVGDPLTASDPDGNELTYSLAGVDAGAFEVDGATAQISVPESTTLDYEDKASYSLEIRVSDGTATASRTVQVFVTDVDEAPGPVSAPMVTEVSETMLNVSWPQPDNAGPSITAYEIRYRRTGQSDWTQFSTQAPATMAELAGLQPGTRYEAQVRAVNDEGSGLWSPATAAATTEPEWWADWRALVALYHATNGPNWWSNVNWNVTRPPPNVEELDSWSGVLVANGRVVGLLLGRNNLSGSLPAELGDLASLELIGLDDNHLTGAIPPELGNLSNLTLLSLPNNDLMGSIPASLGNLSNLEQLNLGQNALTGSIPATLGKLSRLKVLSLSDNGLTGQVPSELANLTALETLNLSGNALTGALPEQLTQLSNISTLLWGRQTFSPGEFALCAPEDRTFQDWLTRVPTTQGFHCGANRTISGQLLEDWRTLVGFYDATDGPNWHNNEHWSTADTPPTAVGLDAWHGVTVSDGRVTELNLWGNGLSGNIPPALGNLRGLKALVLSRNAFTGSIPAQLADLLNLDTLSLAHNALTGPIPAELGRLSKLRRLYLNGNSLAGEVPAQLAIASLRALELSVNALTGELPREFERLTNLDILRWGQQVVADDATALCVPSTDGFARLFFSLSSKYGPTCGRTEKISGALLEDWLALLAFYRATNGPSWRLNSNWTESDTPPTIEEIESWYGVTITDGRVSKLRLFENNLSGTLPHELGDLTALTELFLSRNRLQGTIPTQLGRLVSLEKLLLSSNALSGPIPRQLGALSALTSLHLNDNQLSGPIPPEVGALSALTSLLLDNNQLSGPIPPEVGNLNGLWRLDLSVNALTGPIPPELGNLAALRTLWLHRNELTGTIPAALRKLPILEYLRLGENALEGSVPAELADLHNLYSLGVEYNALSGELPTELTRLSNLRVLYWGEQKDNLLGGRTPLCAPADEAFQRWLEHLVTFGDTCGAPDSLRRDWEALVALYNATDGPNWRNNDNWSTSDTPPTPAQLHSWHGVTVNEHGRVQSLELDNNALAGSIPPELGNLTSLITLTLNGNALTGPLPQTLTSLKQLRILFWGNQAVPTGATALCAPTDPSFQEWLLDVQRQFGLKCGIHSGSLLEDWRTLVALYKSTDGDNWRNNQNWSVSETPPTPEELSRWHGVGMTHGRVTSLVLIDNALSGMLPAALADLALLENLNISGNERLTGAIPERLGQLSNLTSLDLTGNALGGPVPEEFGNLLKLRRLMLSDNTLEGPMPLSLTNLRHIEEMRWSPQGDPVGGNPLCAPLDALFQHWLKEFRLRGPNCPPESGSFLDDWRALVALYNATNGADWHRNDNWSASGSAPSAQELDSWFGVTVYQGRVTELDLRTNALTGVLPEELGGLSALLRLMLHNNELTGRIPPQLGNLTRLIELDLHTNRLQGPIPSSLGNLAELQDLDLYHNELEGSLPEDLGDLSRLESLDLRDNRLMGPIPANFTDLTYMRILRWEHQRVPEGSVALCAPTDARFQRWLAALALADGPDCSSETDPSGNLQPVIVDVSVTSSPGPTGAYGVGEVVEVSVRFSERVTVSGAPRLNLDIGAVTVPAVHKPSQTSYLHSFRYVVNEGDHDSDGISVGGEALELNGGAILSARATQASTDLGANAIINAPDHIVDARVIAAERAVLTDALAAKGRALISSTTTVIGERFRAERTARGSGLIGDLANTFRGPDVVLDRSQEHARHTAPYRVEHCNRTLVFAVQIACNETTGSNAGLTVGPGFGQPSPGLPWARAFSVPLSEKDAAAAGWTLWGAEDVQSFEGESAQGDFDGRMRSAYLGIDVRLNERWLAGMAVSSSRGASAYSFAAGEENHSGTFHTRLTSVYPYIHRNVSDGWSAWGIGGIGYGEASGQRHELNIVESAGLTMGLTAAGFQRKLITRESLGVSLISDVGLVRLVTGERSTVLDALSVSVGRARVGIEGEHTFGLGRTGSLRPYWQVNSRYDAGDGYTGTGMELGAGLRYSTARVEAELQARWLAVRSREHYREFGATASIELKARPDGLGLSASLQQSWGAPAAGASVMWRPQALRVANRGNAMRSGVLHSADARIGYTLALPHRAGRLTPFSEFRLSGESSVHSRSGVRLDRSNGQHARMGLEAAIGLVGRPSGQGSDGAIDLSMEARF